MNFGTYGMPLSISLNSGLFGLPKSSSLWTPKNITTQLWLDASDSSTILLTSDAVSQWSDKSGNNRHLIQNTAANRPLKGINSINFDGINDFLSTSSTFPSLTDFSIFAVADGSAIPTNQERGLLAIDNGNNTGYLLGYWFERTSFSGGTLSSYIGGTSLNTSSSTIPLTIFTPKILNQIRKLTVSNSLLDNGIIKASVTSGNTVTTSIPSNTLYVGRSDLTYLGNIYEIILISEAVVDDLRLKIEGYLAHKWGLTNNLASTHLYKNLPPQT